MFLAFHVSILVNLYTYVSRVTCVHYDSCNASFNLLTRSWMTQQILVVRAIIVSEKHRVQSRVVNDDYSTYRCMWGSASSIDYTAETLFSFLRFVKNNV